MDPEKTMQDMLDAYKAEDPDACREHCNTLQVWINGGGFLPVAWMTALKPDELKRIIEIMINGVRSDAEMMDN